MEKLAATARCGLAQMMERPQFSIVIPHRDDLIGLVRTLAALERLSKASPSFEVIVADNRSRSGLSATREVAAQFQSLKARVVDAPIAGAGPARNAGVAAARGSAIAFLDCDCLPESDWLDAAACALERADVAGGPVVAALEENRAPITPTELFDVLWGFDVQRSYDLDGLFLTANMITKRFVFDRVGPFRSGLSEDRDWCIRARASGFAFTFSSEIAVRHTALESPEKLLSRWRRVTRETHAFHGLHGLGRSAGLGYHVSVALSPFLHGWRIFSSRASGASAGVRLRALLLLFQVRLDRALLGLRLHFGAG